MDKKEKIMFYGLTLFIALASVITVRRETSHHEKSLEDVSLVDYEEHQITFNHVNISNTPLTIYGH